MHPSATTNKKGISPLIATVLLIGFTVALAAMIMTWGTDFFRKTTDDVDKQRQIALLCTSQLDFQLQVDCGTKKVFVDNRGQVDIVALKLRMQKKADGSSTVEDKPGIAAFARTPFDVANMQELNKISAIATVKTPDGSQHACGNAAREVQVNCP